MADFVYQILSVFGWVLLIISIIVIFWVSEPWISRITARWKQPPHCVLEVGNVNTPLSRVLASANQNQFRQQQQRDILPHELKEQLVDLEVTAKQAAASKSPLTPVIFHGAKGTGKRSAAKQLAHSLAIPFALVSGTALAEGSFFQIDALVSWANAVSNNGIILFIDQADAFLSKDSRGKLMDKFTGVLDGGVRRDIFFVLATRSIDDIDRTVRDRCEEIQFSLPDATCRRQLIVSSLNANNASSLMNRLIQGFGTREQGMSSIDNEVMNAEALEDTIALSRGLTRGQIEELLGAIKTKLHSGLSVWEAIEEAHKMRQLMSSSGNSEHSISMTNLQNEVDFYEVTVV